MTKNTKNRNIDLYSNSQICIWPKAWSLKLTYVEQMRNSQSRQVTENTERLKKDKCSNDTATHNHC